MKKITKPPARVHILVARESKKAIIIRRGPAKQVCILLWDRNNDTFKVSQWLKGRIYERRSDIAADGKHWIYFAANYKYKNETKGTWTAIARVPWLKALTLYGKGDGWFGGGLMLKGQEFWLNDHECLDHFLMFESSEVKKSKGYKPKNSYGGECLNVYYNRLQRDGWSYIKYDEDKCVTIFEKKFSTGWIFRKIAHHGGQEKDRQGVYWDEHELEDSNGKIIVLSNWEWAEYLDNEYIFYIKKGCLYKLKVSTNYDIKKDSIFVHDFNDYKFKELKAPY